jgi:hypothetical protein
MNRQEKELERKIYCRELVYSTELGRKKYIEFMQKSSTSLNMSGKENQLRVPPMQEVKRGGYMYRKRLCPKNM